MAKLDENIKVVMLKGEKGEKGETGTGTPTGGKTGQYLQKKTDADYDFRWSDVTTVAFDNVTGKPSAYPTTWDKVTGKPEATESTAGLMSADDKTKLDNLEVGVRNLFVLSTLGVGGITVDGTVGNAKNRSQSDYIDVGDEKVVTVKPYDIGAYKGIRIGIHSYDADKTHSADTGWVQLNVGQKKSFQLTDNVRYIRVVLSFSSTSETVTSGSTEDTTDISLDGLKNSLKFKVEKTDVTSDWTPAPEDVENEIKALNSTTKSVTLTAASWNSGSYTISDSLITASSNQEILPAVGITVAQMKALQKANIVDAGQSAGSLTLTALGTVPTIDIPIRVIFRGTI